MSQRLDRDNYNTIGVGDVLMDFCQRQQRNVHYLVVDVGHFTQTVTGMRYLNAVLQPLDSDRDWDVRLTQEDFIRPYCTWRRVA
jgi:hypothetical protein